MTTNLGSNLDVALTGAGAIRPDYRHHERIARSAAPLVVTGGVVRWNEVYLPGSPVSPALDALARTHVQRVFAEGEIEPGEGLGFVVLHHSSELDYLLVCMWTRVQEMWEVLFIREADVNADDDQGFRRVQTGVESSTMCVWEMAAVWHERGLWTRYLHSRRELDDRLLWAGDSWEALV